MEKNKILNEEIKKYDNYKSLGLNLNMSRGKPCKEQLDLSMGMMDVLNSNVDLSCNDGTDVRNYGILSGIDECKQLLADIIEVPKENIIIYGNSSLNIMFDLISKSYTHGVLGSTPWCKLDKKVKWLCVVPGYDRHFGITEYFGFEMINVPLLENGPDMDMIEELVKDEMVKGIWCVPKYSNPSGTTYSADVVKRFANLKPKAVDFRIYWDNAYSVHHLYEDNQDFLVELLDECKKSGNPNLVYKFTSTSKISFPGSGIAAVAASVDNIKDIESHLKHQTIGFDKVNQLRHVKFFKNLDGIKLQMKKHADILRPKFELVLNKFEKEIKEYATWGKPYGGYFISLNVENGCAKEVVRLAKEAGVILTDAGCSYPYHIDPSDSNIRIAPSYPSLDELSLATDIVCNVIKIVTIKKREGII